MIELKKLTVTTIVGAFTFVGEYLGDQGTTNWYYYRKQDETIVRFRKEHVVVVHESDV